MKNKYISAKELAKMLGISRSTLYTKYLEPYEKGEITEYHDLINLYMKCDSRTKATELLDLLKGIDNTNKDIIKFKEETMSSGCIHVIYDDSKKYTKQTIDNLYNDLAHLVVELCNEDVKLNKGIEKLDKIFEKYK